MGKKAKIKVFKYQLFKYVDKQLVDEVFSKCTCEQNFGIRFCIYIEDCVLIPEGIVDEHFEYLLQNKLKPMIFDRVDLLQLVQGLAERKKDIKGINFTYELEDNYQKMLIETINEYNHNHHEKNTDYLTNNIMKIMLANNNVIQSICWFEVDNTKKEEFCLGNSGHLTIYTVLDKKSNRLLSDYEPLFEEFERTVGESIGIVNLR